MIIKKVYDEKTKTQRAWYDSTMILYSEMVEYDDSNAGDLYIVFKNGTKYKYEGVSFEDYVLLIGGSTDASHGKTLNKIIKSKYEAIKIGTVDVNEINNMLNETDEKENFISTTYFISGHRNITDNEFEFCYIPLINFALRETENARFVVGDCVGVDIMAQNYLIDIIGINPDNVTVYHMFDSPRNCNPKITNLVGGFQTDRERDAAMTNASFKDIALVRDNTKISGTAENILRRYMLTTF